ncbi:TPA: hypothetical protein ACGIK9_003423 [Acinetobacter baumannii]|uniref:hypothetical protein n=1 Tax=Acinetobacter baumannii TaxID=470 RepID=UPI00338DD8C9
MIHNFLNLIPSKSIKLIYCLNLDVNIIENYALNNSTKSVKQNANFFYQKSMGGKSRTQQYQIMLKFINILKEEKQSEDEFLFNYFKNNMYELQRIEIESFEDFLTTVNCLYSSNENKKLIRLFRLMATKELITAFTDINDVFHSQEQSITDNNRASQAKSVTLLNHIKTFSLLTWSLMFLSAFTFFISSIQGVSTPFNFLITAELPTTNNNYINLYRIINFISIFNLFIVPLAYSYYFNDRITLKADIDTIKSIYKKTIGTTLLFIGSLLLSFLLLKVYELKSPLNSFIQNRDYNSAFEYIEKSYNDDNDIAFMKVQTKIALSKNDSSYSNEVKLSIYDYFNKFSKESSIQPKLAIKEFKDIISQNNIINLFMEKTFFKFLILLILINFILCIIQSRKFSQL